MGGLAPRTPQWKRRSQFSDSPDATAARADPIDKKESDLLAGRDITALSVDELSQFDALVTLERQAVAKLVASQSSDAHFLTVLVNDVLPVLMQIAKVVLPIL